MGIGVLAEVRVLGEVPRSRRIQSRRRLFCCRLLPCAHKVPAARSVRSYRDILAHEAMAAHSRLRPACTARQLILGCVFIASVIAHPCFSYCSVLDASYRCACAQQHFLREAFAVQQCSNRAAVNADTHVLVGRVFPSLFKPGIASFLTQFSSSFQQPNLVNVPCIFTPQYVFRISGGKKNSADYED